MKRVPWALLILLLAALPGQAQEAVKLCYDDANNYPWLDKNGQGLNNRLIDLAAQQSGVKVLQVALPWKRCLASIASGEMAGGFAASYSAEREAYADYPRTAEGKLDPARRMKTDGYSLYRAKGTIAFWDGKAFVNLTGRIGSQLGYASAAELRRHGATVYESGDSPETAMKHLIAGDIQLLALMTYEGDALLSRTELGVKVEKIPSPFIEKPYFVIFNRDYHQSNRRTVEAFWAGLAVARESAAFKAWLREQVGRIAPLPLVNPAATPAAN